MVNHHEQYTIWEKIFGTFSKHQTFANPSLGFQSDLGVAGNWIQKTFPKTPSLSRYLGRLGIDMSGQIIATSHDLTPHGRVVGEPCLKWPYFREIQVGEIL